MIKLYNVEFEGATHNVDYQCDAFITYAEHEDGTPLTSDELDAIDGDTTYEYLIEYLY
jgi:hypothetical protein